MIYSDLSELDDLDHDLSDLSVRGVQECRQGARACRHRTTLAKSDKRGNTTSRFLATATATDCLPPYRQRCHPRTGIGEWGHRDRSFRAFVKAYFRPSKLISVYIGGLSSQGGPTRGLLASSPARWRDASTRGGTCGRRFNVSLQ